MKVLVIGYGSAGRRHAANAKALGCEVMVHDEKWAAPLYDGSADQYWVAANEGGARAWDPDAVVIATPAATHAELVTAWRALPILCEKPLALAATDLDWTEAPRVQVGCNWRWHPLVTRFRSEWQATPERALFWCVTDMASWPGSGYAETLLEIGSHEVDLALYLFGPATLDTAVRTPGPERDRWTLKLAHSSGTVSEIVLVGDEPDRPSRGLRAQRGAHLGGYDVNYGPPGVAEAPEAEALFYSYYAEMRAFLEAVKSGEPMTPSLADGLAVLRIIDEARAFAGGAARG